MSEQLLVQFGSGGNQLEGWRNHDLDLDITKPELFHYEDNTVDMILAEHVIEHVTAPQSFRFFQKCHQILKPGGKILICVPILERVMRYMGKEKAIDLIVNHGHLQIMHEVTLHQALELAGFRSITQVAKPSICGHFRVIGEELDDMESLRMGAVK